MCVYVPVCTHMLALCVPAYFFLMSYISVDRKILFKMFSSNIYDIECWMGFNNGELHI